MLNITSSQKQVNESYHEIRGELIFQKLKKELGHRDGSEGEALAL